MWFLCKKLNKKRNKNIERNCEKNKKGNRHEQHGRYKKRVKLKQASTFPCHDEKHFKMRRDPRAVQLQLLFNPQ